MKTSGIVTITAGAAVAGLLIGMGIGGSGKREMAERAQLQTETAASVEALKERFGALEARLGELGGKIGTMEEGVAQTSSGIGELSDRLDGLGKSVAEAVSGVQSAVTGVNSDLSGKFGSLAERIEAMRNSATSVVAPAATQATPATGQAVRPGETLAFGDGGVVAFLSSVDLAGGTANVALNGTQVQLMTLNEPVTVGTCTLTLTAIAARSAMIDGTCGGTPAGASASPTLSAGLGSGTVVSMANVAVLADGAVRVFLSGLDLTEGSARVAINGTELMTLTLGKPVDVGSCTVSLTGLDGSSASVDAAC